MAAANLYFRVGRYEDADEFYTMLRRDHPEERTSIPSALAGAAIQAAQIPGSGLRHQTARRRRRSGGPIAGAVPAELADERDRIVEARAWIRAAKAEREFQIAKYYDKSKYYAASKIYYAEVAQLIPRPSWPRRPEIASKRSRIYPPLPRGRSPGSTRSLPRPETAWVTRAWPPPAFPRACRRLPSGVGTLGGMGGGMPALGAGT